jgi:hypothetical protein
MTVYKAFGISGMLQRQPAPSPLGANAGNWPLEAAWLRHMGCSCISF